MDELDIWRTAKTLIDAYGPQVAWQKAAARAVEVVDDKVGLAVWLRVIDAIDELTRVHRRRGETVQ